MKRYLALFVLALLFCAVLSIGCGGGSDNDTAEPEQTESLNQDTGSEDTGEYDPNDEGRGGSGSGKVTNLSGVWNNYVASDGETLTGKLNDYAAVKISIADGATVTIKDVTIPGIDSENCRWAGLNCEGNATIIVEGKNSIMGFYASYPGVHVPAGKTMTIKGSGSLDTGTRGGAPGIGGGYRLPCGNIVIDGPYVAGWGTYGTASIGSGRESSCGDITIKSGSVYAKGGQNGAGIGSGMNSRCGKITISGGTVTAIGGEYSAGIGTGVNSSCGEITINGGSVNATGASIQLL